MQLTRSPTNDAQPAYLLKQLGKMLRPVILPLVTTIAATVSVAALADQTIPEPAGESSQPRQPLQTAEAFNFGNSNALIISVGSSVFSDIDNDGFFSRFSLSFDADVRFGEELVYANIFLRADDSDYLFFHRSDAFEIYESSPFDEYRLDSELVSNYPAGYYDVRIELREAFSDSLLDVVDASTHRTLFALPLESRDSGDFGNIVNTQILGPQFIEDSQNSVLRDQIVREQVGASYALLPLLGLGLLARQKRRKKTAGNQG